ncbi:hypothetical protein PGTUg99_000148 [Puccinia graminis f. sp. tritici]|uniref:Uncharacterized protein n=1 Tax=Puccinia graminis f. sp. tritici TaxID=56615 RepID=A0A5B0SG42_PUCGR|nr:hypothetical protein PGTUg99_000148 [Puccinia graminis f. sp. tritici]
MKFHKRVPSFSFTSFTFNNNNTTAASSNNNEQPEPCNQPKNHQPQQSHSQNNSLSHQQQQETPRPSPNDQQQLAHRPRNGSITLLLSPDDPLRFIVQSPKACSPRKRSGSLVEQSMSSPTPDQSDTSGSARRRSSFAEPSSSNSNSSTSHFTRHRKRLSNLFSPLSYYSNNSRSPSPANRSGRLRQSSHSVDPESDRESTLDSSSIHPQIDLPSSSEDDSDSNHSNSDQSSDLEPELTDPEAETILANTNANASSITPIDYLQKSNQPIPFIDQAPNITPPHHHYPSHSPPPILAVSPSCVSPPTGKHRPAVGLARSVEGPPSVPVKTSNSPSLDRSIRRTVVRSLLNMAIG